MVMYKQIHICHCFRNMYNAMRTSMLADMIKLFGADYTVEFLVLAVWWAGKVAVVTPCFSMVEESTIGVTHTVR
jgi:hypothetical protein